MEYNRCTLQEIKLYYLNQINGPVPLGLSIQQGTRNHVDGGIQLSPIGPDLWSMDASQVKVTQAHDNSSLNIRFDQFNVDEGDTHIQIY